MAVIDELPNYIEHEFYDDDTFVAEKRKCFLSLNRDINGQWSCGYITWDDDGSEMAIPQLVTNQSSSITEAAVRMRAKVERFMRLERDKDSK